jgi:hypothetical protein
MKNFYLVVLAVFLVSSVLGQSEILTNKSITSMLKAGLSSEIIVSKIEGTNAKFDVSTNGLIALKTQKVPDAVINAMVKKGSNTASSPQPEAEPIKSKKSETGNIPPIEFVNQVHAFFPLSNKLLPLEKSVANFKTKMKALGYGGTDMVYEIGGDKSTIRLNSSDSVFFLINSGGAMPEFVLYKLKVDKKKRSAAYMKAGMTGVKSGENTIGLNIVKVSDGTYKLVPVKAIEKGEYFFAGKTQTGTSVDVYAFGVD